MTTLCRAILAGMAVAVWTGAAVGAEMVANGIFLIAKREMRDPRFQQTVVLVTQPPQGGPFGVIINRPLDHPLAEVFPDQATMKGRKDVLYFGGPVGRDGLMFLVRTSKRPARAVHVRAGPLLNFQLAAASYQVSAAELPASAALVPQCDRLICP